MDPKYASTIEQLAAPLQELKDGAREKLVKAGAAAVPSLVEALDHQERDVRAGACLALAQLKADEAASGLARLAGGDLEASVRPLALRALAALARPDGPAAVRDALLAQVGSDDMFARALACEGLGKIRDSPSLQQLDRATKDAEEWVRNAANKALHAPPKQAAPTAQTTLPVKVEARKDGLTPLAGGLQSLKVEVQQFAQQTLVERGESSVDEVIPVLLGGPPEARRAAAEVLARIGAPAGMRPLHQLLVQEGITDGLRAVTLHCMAIILRKSGPLAGFPGDVVIGLMDLSQDRFVRAGAASALITAGGMHRAWALSALDEEDAQWVMLQAGKALARTASPDDRELIPAIVTLLSSMTEPEGQVVVLEALRLIVDRPSDQARHLVGPVSFFLESQDQAVRRVAAMVLARTGEPLDRQHLEVVLQVLEADPWQGMELMGAVARMAHPEDPLPVAVLARLLRSPDAAVAGEAVKALSGMQGIAALDALVEVANSRAGAVTAAASQALAARDPGAEVAAVRLPEGRWERRVRQLCACKGELRWVQREGREELRCPQCDKEYVPSPAGKLFDADATPFGLCLCVQCSRKRLLVRRADSDVLICPESKVEHVRPFDHPRQLRRLDQLQYGACTCCEEPQPLIKVNDELVCYRSRRPYRAAARGFVLANPPADAAAPAQPQDVAAINRALLMGTLSLSESGVPAGTGDDDDE